MKKAISYIRFSSKKQEEGDSLRRQTALANAYCSRHGWTLDPSTYKDLGVSAWKGKNALVGNLGEFLKAVANGTVKKGTGLIVESFDRITRQGIDEGYDLIKKILKSGIVIITLAPEREFTEEATKSLSKGALEIQVILERAAEENERRSERRKHAYVANRQKVKDGKGLLDRELPCWVREVNGKLELVPEKADTVRYIVQLSLNGLGSQRILKELEGKVPPITRFGKWRYKFVGELLTDPRLTGELRMIDGTVIQDYFPAVISEAEFNQMRLGVSSRKNRGGGGKGKKVNLFAGILINARDVEDTFMMKVSESNDHLLVNKKALTTKGTLRSSVPYSAFETALLTLLTEVKAEELTTKTKGPSEVDILQGKLVTVRETKEEHKCLLKKKPSDVLADLVVEDEQEEKELLNQLNTAQQKAAQPLATSWNEAKGLFSCLETNEDRLRLRGVLRRVIKNIKLLVITRGQTRYVAAQVTFDSPHELTRTYFLKVVPARSRKIANLPKKPGQWWAISFKHLPSPLQGSPKKDEPWENAVVDLIEGIVKEGVSGEF